MSQQGNEMEGADKVSINGCLGDSLGPFEPKDPVDQLQRTLGTLELVDRPVTGNLLDEKYWEQIKLEHDIECDETDKQ